MHCALLRALLLRYVLTFLTEQGSECETFPFLQSFACYNITEKALQKGKVFQKAWLIDTLTSVITNSPWRKRTRAYFGIILRGCPMVGASARLAKKI